MTPQRLSILRTVLTRLDHPTAEEVYREVRQGMPTVSMTTVYHTLETLVEIGAFARVSPYPDVRRYDKDVSEHLHVICSRCDQVVDLPAPASPAVTGIQQSTGFKGLKPIQAFVGICPRCQAT